MWKRNEMNMNMKRNIYMTDWEEEGKKITDTQNKINKHKVRTRISLFNYY